MSQPKWFKPASIFILIWMALGVTMFIMDLLTTPEQAAALPEAQRMLREARPTWLMGIFGVATGLGLLGAIALVMKKEIAVSLLSLSLAAVVVQFGYTIVGMDAIAAVGAGHALGVPGFIFLMGAFSLWVAIKGRNAQWLS
jgi:hypothetical protein